MENNAQDTSNSVKDVPKDKKGRLESETKKDNDDSITFRRLKIIQTSITWCFFIFLSCIGIMIIDQLLWEGEITNSHVLTILITVITTSLTTLLGVVIGSSVDPDRSDK